MREQSQTRHRSKTHHEIQYLFPQYGCSRLWSRKKQRRYRPTTSEVGCSCLAQQIANEFGDKVHITLGSFSWPDPTVPYPESRIASLFGTVMPTTGSKVSWSTPQHTQVVSPGAAIVFTVRVRSANKQTMPFTRLIVVVTKRHSKRIVGIRSDVASPTLNPIYLVGGRWNPFVVGGGTDSCDASHGWALRPGTYDGYVTTPEPDDGVVFTSPPFPILVRKSPLLSARRGTKCLVSNVGRR